MRAYIIAAVILLGNLASLCLADTPHSLSRKDCLIWGPRVNGLRIGLAINKKDFENPKFQSVFVTLSIDGSQNSKLAVFVMDGEYRGVLFIKKAASGSNQILAGDLLKRSVGGPVLGIGPKQEGLLIDLVLDKKEFQKLINESAFAMMTIHEAGVPSFNLEVKVVVPK